MRPVCAFTDYFVICHGNNARQTEGDLGRGPLPDEARRCVIPVSVDGEREASWIVADYLDVVLHVFTPEARQYYRLEDLWSDVPSEVVEAVPV